MWLSLAANMTGTTERVRPSARMAVSASSGRGSDVADHESALVVGDGSGGHEPRQLRRASRSDVARLDVRFEHLHAQALPVSHEKLQRMRCVPAPPLIRVCPVRDVGRSVLLQSEFAAAHEA
jgi:hypothetical protein